VGEVVDTLKFKGIESIVKLMNESEDEMERKCSAFVLTELFFSAKG
jgi:hypothetical protein